MVDGVRIELSARCRRYLKGKSAMPETGKKEEKKIKVHADGNGGLYVKPEDVFKNPGILAKIKALNETGPMAKTPPKDSPRDS